MTTLISCVGNSDPIRNYHDGPLLHLARVLKPEKIVLVHSELTIPRHDVISQAIQSIPKYDPIIIAHNKIILNEQIFLFDEMFNQMNEIIMGYFAKGDNIILNLSSGTPQVISALFSINRIHDFNVKAYQVATPNKSSNVGIVHENINDIDLLIEYNEDNQYNYKNRLVEDKGLTFSNILLKNTMIDLINHYNYSAALDISFKKKLTTKKNRKKIIKKLSELEDFVSYQKILSDIEAVDLNKEEKTLLNAALLIDLQSKRKLTSEVLIRIQNLTEKIVEYYLETNHKGTIEWKEDKPYLSKINTNDLLNFINEEYRKTSYKKDKLFNYKIFLSLPTYIIILKYFKVDNEFLNNLGRINGAKKHRNNVAHDLKEINKKEVNIVKLTETCWRILEEVIDVDQKWHSYFTNVNAELKELIYK